MLTEDALGREGLPGLECTVHRLGLPVVGSGRGVLWLGGKSVERWAWLGEGVLKDRNEISGGKMKG